jgi:hypothetical protein
MASALELFRMSSKSLIAEGSGDGYYSSVYKTRFHNLVVKKGFKAREDGWLAYACLVLALGDDKPSWMPDILALKINWGGNCFEALMGTLTPRPVWEDEIDQCYSFTVENYGDTFGFHANHGINATARSIFKALFDLDAQTGGRIAAMGIHFDGHNNNWMMRGSSLVLNDPLCGPDHRDLLRQYVDTFAALHPNKITIEGATA